MLKNMIITTNMIKNYKLKHIVYSIYKPQTVAYPRAALWLKPPKIFDPKY